MRFFFIAIAFVFIASCSSSTDIPAGSEGGPCFLNSTCDNGLECLSKLCVNNHDSETAAITDSFTSDANMDSDTSKSWDSDTAATKDADSSATPDFDVAYTGSWTTHGDLKWSDKAPNEMVWDIAVSYCISIGGRLPTITELRTLIQNCPGTGTDGACGVIDSCLTGSCYSLSCGSCTSVPDGRYSVFGDTCYLHSSSEQSDNTYNYTWSVSFINGRVNLNSKNDDNFVRCVQ